MARSASPSGRSFLSSLIVGMLWFAAIYLVAFGGCLVQHVQKEYFPAERVAAYTAKKPAVIDRENPARPGTIGEQPTGPTEIKDRMLAAIVLHNAQGWFFKLTGPIPAMEKQAETFRSFVESIHFDGPDSPPHWKLPEGWDEQAGNEMRFATLVIGGDGPPLSVTVSTLPRGDGDETDYLLANVNRWRGQMGQPNLVARELAKELKEFKVEGAKAFLVDISGQQAGGGMGRGPFSGGGGPFRGGAPPEAGAPPAAPAAAQGITFKAPAGWSPGKAGGMRKAAYVVEEGPASAEITIIDLPAAVNDLVSNVNRWRGQVGLKEAAADEIKKSVRDVDVAGKKAQFVELVGPEKTLLGVIAFEGDKAWFVKLIGDSALAKRERENFEAFVGSIQFSAK